MSSLDLTRLEGVVASSFAAGIFSVDLANGHSIRARTSGRLRRLRTDVVVGDKVLVGLFPSNVTHGLIMSRARASKQNP
jgi:translation initiation factor IF-1